MTCSGLFGFMKDSGISLWGRAVEV